MTYNPADFQKTLGDLSDKKYKQFLKKIGIGKLEPIGVQVPKLKLLAKQLAKENWQQFFFCEPNQNPETIILKGLCLGFAKLDNKTFWQFLQKFFFDGRKLGRN